MKERRTGSDARNVAMDELRADQLARVLGGQIYLTDGQVWVVVIDRSDGRVVVLTETSVDEYADWKAFKAGHCYASIQLS
jgi:hypothetical protein